MSYVDPTDDPFRRRPARRPATPRPATAPATVKDAATAFVDALPSDERAAWTLFAADAAEQTADLLGHSITYTKELLTGGRHWDAADDVLTAADAFGEVWFRGGFAGRVRPGDILGTLVSLPLFTRIAQAVSGVFGELALVAAKYHIGGADRVEVLDAAAAAGETYLRAAGVLGLIRGDHGED